MSVKVVVALVMQRPDATHVGVESDERDGRPVARLPDGDEMAELCREFNISRNTGYNIFPRYKDLGSRA